MQEYTNAIIAVITAIIGLATLSVILSKQANTSGVISSASSGLTQLISAAVSPISGISGLSTSIQPLVH